MEKQSIHLTDAEWSLMECLWEASPRTAMQAVEDLKKRVGWAKSTTLTMLRRMTAKGLVRCDESGPARLYTPAVDRQAAVREETRSFLQKVYKGDVGLLMSAMAREAVLTQPEIDALYEILQNAEVRKND